MFNIKIDDFDIEKIALSGQCFRMTKIGKENLCDKWQLIATDRYCYALVDPFNGSVKIECPKEDNMFWMYYFDLNTDYAHFRNAVDKDDVFLTNAVEFGKGIRILRQSSWEMLITYIISQRRSIPSIKTCVERICKRWGRELSEGVYSFPTPKELEIASLDELLECGLGYRAEYVYLATKGVLDGTIDLFGYENLNDEDLLEALMKIRGVGKKVANCVSLFGYYRIAAFPVDVWIDRVQNQFYRGHFPTDMYEGFAGVMQQYMFYFIRNN